jgi:hypothetical protein
MDKQTKKQTKIFGEKLKLSHFHLEVPLSKMSETKNTIAPSEPEVAPTETPAAEQPPVSPGAVAWMATILEEAEEEERERENIAAIFEDLPTQEPKDYIEAEAVEVEQDYDERSECSCDECQGISNEDQYLCFAGLCYDQSCWDCVRRGEYYSHEVGFDLADEF